MRTTILIAAALGLSACASSQATTPNTTKLPLGDNHNCLVLAEGIDQLHRAFASHGQRENSVGKEHGVTNREYRKRSIICWHLLLSARFTLRAALKFS